MPFERVEEWGRMAAEAVADRLIAATPVPGAALATAFLAVHLPVEALDAEGIETRAEEALRARGPIEEWGDRYRRAVAGWRRFRLEAIREGRSPGWRDAELFAVRVGGAAFLGVNAEVFSELADLIRARAGGPVYVVGYANGVLGYIPTRRAYEEGGYEVETAHFFYGDFRPLPGGLELIAERGAELLRSVREA